jgi:hypothetical protein
MYYDRDRSTARGHSTRAYRPREASGETITFQATGAQARLVLAGWHRVLGWFRRQAGMPPRDLAKAIFL